MYSVSRRTVGKANKWILKRGLGPGRGRARGTHGMVSLKAVAQQEERSGVYRSCWLTCVIPDGNFDLDKIKQGKGTTFEAFA